MRVGRQQGQLLSDIPEIGKCESIGCVQHRSFISTLCFGVLPERRLSCWNGRVQTTS